MYETTLLTYPEVLEIYRLIKIFPASMFFTSQSCYKFSTRTYITYISKRQSEFSITRWFYFHETSQVRKLPDLQYKSSLQAYVISSKHA